jgi:hypothetical protein
MNKELLLEVALLGELAFWFLQIKKAKMVKAKMVLSFQSLKSIALNKKYVMKKRITFLLTSYKKTWELLMMMYYKWMKNRLVKWVLTKSIIKE